MKTTDIFERPIVDASIVTERITHSLELAMKAAKIHGELSILKELSSQPFMTKELHEWIINKVKQY